MSASNFKNNIDKKMEARDGISLAKDIQDIEFDVLQNLADTIREDFEKERKEGQTFMDWLNSKPDEYFKRIELSDGGKVVDFLKRRKSKDLKPKQIDLTSLFTPSNTLASLNEHDREVVNRLLKLTFGKGD
jgi:hypothetical protein